jgi:hypothetical protein
MKSSQRKVKILEYMKESATMILDKIAAEYFHEVMEDDYEE